MSNYASYQSSPTPETTEQAPSGPNLYVHQGAVSMTIVNGETTTTTHGSHSYNTGDTARDAHGDSWRGTARSKFGNPTATITADSLVTINGVQGRVKDFVRSGDLRESAPGVFEEGAAEAPQAAPQEQQADLHAAVMPDEVVGGVNAALEPVSDSALPGIVSVMVGVASGTLSMDEAIAHTVRATGMDPAEVRQRLGYVSGAYQAQTDAFLTHRLGIPASDLPGFYADLRRNPREMQDALNQQMNARTMSAWARLAEKNYFSKQPPTEAALKAAGFETRNHAGVPEVRINGQWASVKGAAKAGLI